MQLVFGIHNQKLVFFDKNHRSIAMSFDLKYDKFAAKVLKQINYANFILLFGKLADFCLGT